MAGIGTAVEDTKANKEAAEAAQAAAEQAQAGAEAAAQGAAEEVKEELQGLVDQAETAKTGAETAKSGAEAARTAIENMLVEAITLETGQPATVSKSLVDEVVKLTFGLPAVLLAQKVRPETLAPALTVSSERAVLGRQGLQTLTPSI